MHAVIMNEDLGQFLYQRDGRFLEGFATHEPATAVWYFGGVDCCTHNEQRVRKYMHNESESPFLGPSGITNRRL